MAGDFDPRFVNDMPAYDPWTMDLMHDHGFEGFIDFLDAELAITREAGDQETEAMDTAGADNRLIEAEQDD
jgi:hypothetical protein